MAIAFSDSGSDIVGVKLHIKKHETNSEPERFRKEFEIEDTWNWIAFNKYQRVALQFPEELFHISAVICLDLQQRSGGRAEFAVLAEKKYGSCCVDEVGAEHFAADSIVHYGAACLSPHTRIPVRYVFVKKFMDVGKLVEQLKSIDDDVSSKEELVVIYDMCYHHMRGEIIDSISASGLTFYCPEIVAPSPGDSMSGSFKKNENLAEENSEIILGRKFDKTKAGEKCRFVYVGSDDKFLATLMIIFSQVPFTLYAPDLDCLYPDISKSSKMMMKRYYMIERAKDSNFIGILVGTLDVAGYMEVLEKLKTAILAAGKKCRVYSPGTLNPAKLANLAEFDAYVLIACPLNSIMDSSEYYQPIVTPYEMILACQSNFKWPPEYKLNFKEIVKESLSENDSTTTDLSLITGRLRKIGHDDTTDYVDSCNGILSKKSTPGSVMKSSDFLNSRTWKGLQPRLGETPVSNFVEGSTGTASGYQHEIQKYADEF